MLAEKLQGFVKDSFLYGIGDGLGRLISLVMLPILTRAFVPTDYGAIDLLFVGYMFILVGISLNVYPGITKQYYKLVKGERKILVTTACFFIVILAVIVSMLLLITAAHLSDLIIKNPSLTAPIQVLALCLPIELLFNLLQLLLRLERKAVLFAVSNVTRVIIMPFLVFFMVVVLDMGIIGVFLSKIISLSLLTTGVFFLERKQFGLAIHLTVFRKLILFTLPGFPAMMIKQLMEILPRSILAAFAPLSAVGLFGIASRVSQLMNFFIMAFNRAWSPFAFANADKPEEKKIYEIIFKSFAFTLILLGLGLSLFAEEVITLLTPTEYHTAYYFVSGLVFYRGMRGLAQIFGTALYVIDKVKWTSYLYILQLFVFLVTALILVPRFHTLGLIIAMDITVIIFFIFYMYITLNNFKFIILKTKLILLLTVAASAIFFFYHLDSGIILSLLLKILFIICYITFGVTFLLTTWEKQQAIQLIRGSLPVLRRG